MIIINVGRHAGSIRSSLETTEGVESELTVQVPTVGAATCTCSLVLTESATDSPLPLYLLSRG
jgi:hypothetical protein